MKRQLSLSFWIEAGLACLSGLFLVLTLLWEDWIEIVFGVDPDNGNGSLEWMIAVACIAITVVFGLLARQQWQKAALASGPSRGIG